VAEAAKAAGIKAPRLPQPKPRAAAPAKPRVAAGRKRRASAVRKRKSTGNKRAPARRP
jgi:hypothetical protein